MVVIAKAAPSGSARVVAFVLAVGLVVAVGPAVGIGAAPPVTVRIPVGTYAGLVSWSTEFGGASGLQARSFGVGPLRIVASDASVAGTWSWAGHGSGSLTRGSLGGSVDAALSFGGIAKGTPDAPELDGTFMVNGTFTGSGDAEGVSAPVNASIEGSFPLPVHSASCKRIAGDFVPQFRGNLAGAGLTLKNDAGKWVAFRMPVKLTGDLQASVDVLIADIEKLQTAFAAGEPIDKAKLLDVLLRAELFAKKLPVDKACKTSKATGKVSSFLGAYVALLIGSALPRAEELTLDELTDLARTAQRIGLFTSPDPTIKELETRLQTAIDQKLTAAITAGDALGIQLVATTAKQLGWKDLADRATKALKK